MLRRLWILVAIAWLIGGTCWVVASDWHYVEYHRDEARRQEAISAYEAASGHSFKDWQEACVSQLQGGLATQYCDSPGPMPSRKGMDYYKHEFSALAPIIYRHFKQPIIWMVLAPILFSAPLVLWLIPGLVRWVRYGSKAPAKVRQQNAEISSTVTRGRS